MLQGLVHNHLCLSTGMCPYTSLASRHLLRDVEGEKGLSHLWTLLPHFLTSVPTKEQAQHLLIACLPLPHPRTFLRLKEETLPFPQASAGSEPYVI